MAIIVATNNPGKIAEIRKLLKNKVKFLTLEEAGHLNSLAEDQETIEGNAIQKATFVFSKFKKPCMADDSGLEVQMLGGAPGVYSARYAGPHRNNDDNIDLLLANLRDVPNRRALFRTVVAFCDETGVTCFEGILNGTILQARNGTGGFGYDPVFQPEGFTKTLAQMSIAEKNLISHRSIAVRAMVRSLALDLRTL